MQLAIIAILVFVGLLLVLETRRYFKNRHIRPWVVAETREIDDPVLGRCTIELPVIGQNQSKGFVKCTRVIDSNSVSFTSDFIDKTGGTDGLDDAILELRPFYLLANNPESMKLFKNSTLSCIEMHDTIFPNSPITADELWSSVKLTSVFVLDQDRAWFFFFSKSFMQGRAQITLTVTKEGSVEFCGVG